MIAISTDVWDGETTDVSYACPAAHIQEQKADPWVAGWW